MKTDLCKSRLCGAASALYMAAAYFVGILIFLFILRYPQITSVEEKLRIVVEMRSVIFLTNLLMYVFFGPVLVLFILTLSSPLKRSAPLLVNFSAVIGFIWAGSLTASGMIANAALEPVINLHAANPAEAVLFWQMIETVTTGIGNGNGEILGGVMTLGFGIAMIKTALFRKALAVFTTVVGLIGIVSAIPGLTDLVGLFGLLQLLWFLFVGAALFKKERGEMV